MPIVSVRNNENNEWKRNAGKKTQNKTKKKTKKRTRGAKARGGKRVRAKWFCCAFKVGFLQLICKAS